MTGLFVTFEGGEGSGKTTLISMLKERFLEDGVEVVVTREPGSTVIGEALRDMVLNPKFKGKICDMTEALLFLASRAQHIKDVIMPALSQGKVVLCDRFNDSTVVYQGLGRRLGLQQVKQLCSLACQGLTPDKTLLCDVDPTIGLARVKKINTFDRIENETLEFHKMVRQGFLSLAEEEHARFSVIDASVLSLDEMLEQAWQILLEMRILK